MKLLLNGRSLGKKGLAAALASGMIVSAASCAGQEVLNFYRVMTTGTQFSNYKYTFVMESPQLKESVMSNPSMSSTFQNFFDGLALTGIITDEAAFSMAFQLRIDNQYKDVTQVVVRDNKIYIDLGSILDTMKALAPDMYAKQIQPALTQAAASLDNSSPEVNAQLEAYGVTADQLKSRLGGSLGWVSISFSAIDDVYASATEANEAIKDAIPIKSLGEIDSDGYPDALKSFANNLGSAIEKRFMNIKPSFADTVKDDSTAYTFHLNNENFEAFLDGMIGFLKEDVMTLIDASVADIEKEGYSDAANAFKSLKEELLKETESVDEQGNSVKLSAIDSCIKSLEELKTKFNENSSKVPTFDWLSKVSLKGSEGGREWVMSSKVSADAPEGTEVSNAAFEHLDLKCQITMQEFKDASAALEVMANPESNALSLDKLVSTAYTQASQSLSSISTYTPSSMSDYPAIKENTGSSDYDLSSYSLDAEPITTSAVDVTAPVAAQGTDYESILTVDNFYQYVIDHQDEHEAIEAWVTDDPEGQALYAAFTDRVTNDEEFAAAVYNALAASIESTDTASSADSNLTVEDANAIAGQVYNALDAVLQDLKSKGVTMDSSMSLIKGGHCYSEGSYDYWEIEGLTNVSGTSAFGNYGSSNYYEAGSSTLEQYLAYALSQFGISPTQEVGFVGVVDTVGNLKSVALVYGGNIMLDSYLPVLNNDGTFNTSNFEAWTNTGKPLGIYNSTTF